MDQTLSNPEIEELMVQFYDQNIGFDIKGYMTQPSRSASGGTPVLDSKPASDFIKPKTQTGGGGPGNGGKGAGGGGKGGGGGGSSSGGGPSDKRITQDERFSIKGSIANTFVVENLSNAGNS